MGAEIRTVLKIAEPGLLGSVILSSVLHGAAMSQVGTDRQGLFRFPYRKSGEAECQYQVFQCSAQVLPKWGMRTGEFEATSSVSM